jgi:addiction module HigA family antidote
MAMKTPPHPGSIIKYDVIEPLGLTVTNAAEILGVTRSNLSMLLNERIDLSPEMALRIEKAFGPKMDHLMRIQLNYTLSQIRGREKQIRVRPYVAQPSEGAYV